MRTHVAWKPYFSAMMDMTSFNGLLSSRYSVLIVVLYCSQASAGTCSRVGLTKGCVRGGNGGCSVTGVCYWELAWDILSKWNAYRERGG